MVVAKASMDGTGQIDVNVSFDNYFERVGVGGDIASGVEGSTYGILAVFKTEFDGTAASCQITASTAWATYYYSS